MRARKVCSIVECGNDNYCRGYCCTHYHRWKKTGHALAPTRSRSKSSDVSDFYHNTIAEFDGDECLTWPFARTPDGYCVMRLNGKTGIVSKFVCERFNGKPASPDLQAAHSCSNGHLGCVNRKHLSWKTPAENTKDRIAFGKRLTGESVGLSKSFAGAEGIAMTAHDKQQTPPASSHVVGPTAEQERLRFEGDLDKWMKIIGAGITGYQPEAYALMDLACHELVKLRAMLSFLNNNVGLELVWQEVNGDPSECGWHLFLRFGGRSDRDFKIVGTGETVEEAIKHAMEESL